MALNVPAGNVRNLSFGPGILYITAFSVSNGTPNVDIGYCRGASFQVTRSKIDVYQGSPRSYITTFANQEDVSLSVTGIEWNLFNLQNLLGAGSTGTPTANDYSFGGTVTFAEVGLLYRHKTPTSGTVDIQLWRCQGMGELNIAFGDDIQEFQFQFRALESASTWTNNALSDGAKLFRIKYIQG